MNDIKKITQSLKGEPHKIEEEIKVKNEKKNVIPIRKKSKEDNEFFSQLKEIIDDKEYGSNSVVYLDENIHEVFSLIKLKKKIPIGQLISHLLENWITERSDEITKLTSNNKYL